MSGALFNLWVVPTRHKELSQRYNTTMPMHVPISRGVVEDKVKMLTEMIPKRTIIKNCGKNLKLMMNTEHEYAVGYDCKVYGEMDGSLVLHELYQDIDMEDFLMMFPETAKMSVIQEDLDAVLCFSRRSLEYPFPYELFVPDEYDFL